MTKKTILLIWGHVFLLASIPLSNFKEARDVALHALSLSIVFLVLSIAEKK